MTFHLSNLQLNALRLFTAQSDNRLTLDEFSKIDQRITSGLGRRKEPLVVKSGREEFALTKAGLETIRAMEQTDVFRKFASLTVAKCFGQVTHRGLTVVRAKRGTRKRAAA